MDTIGFRPATSTATSGDDVPEQVALSRTGQFATMVTLEGYAHGAATGHGQRPAKELLTIQYLGPETYLLHPLYVSVQQETSDTWLALSDDLGLAGSGSTDDEAVDDLRSQIAELLVMLRELRGELGPDLMGQLGFLERLQGR